MGPWIVFLGLGALALGTWGFNKYREFQAEKRSEELRNLYASVQSEGSRRA